MWTARTLASPSTRAASSQALASPSTPPLKGVRLPSSPHQNITSTQMMEPLKTARFFHTLRLLSTSRSLLTTTPSGVGMIPRRNGGHLCTPSTGSRSLVSTADAARRTSLSSKPLMINNGLIQTSPLSCLYARHFADLSAKSTEALRNIKSALHTPVKRMQLTKKEKRTLQGNVRRYTLMGGRPEFHHIDLNRNGRIFEPTDTFEVVISSSKNNCWVTVNNKGRGWRTAFVSHAGNIGQRKADRKLPSTTYRIAQNIARKLKRMGVSCCEVRCRYLMKVEICLQAFQAHGLLVTKITHVPRLPKGKPTKARKRRRV